MCGKQEDVSYQITCNIKKEVGANTNSNNSVVIYQKKIMSADIDHIKALAALLNEINGDDDDDDYDILGTTPRGAIIVNNVNDDKSNDDNDEVMTPQAFITDAPGSSQQQQQRRV